MDSFTFFYIRERISSGFRKKKPMALLSKNPSPLHGWGLRRCYRRRPIQRRSMSTINPGIVVISFETCAVDFGIKGGYGRRQSIVCAVGSHAVCARFRDGFGRRHALDSSFVGYSTVVIPGCGFGGGSPMWGVFEVGQWHAQVGMVRERFRPPNSLCWLVSSSTRFRPPDLCLRSGLRRYKFRPYVGASFSWAWCEAFMLFVEMNDRSGFSCLVWGLGRVAWYPLT